MTARSAYHAVRSNARQIIGEDKKSIIMLCSLITNYKLPPEIVYLYSMYMYSQTFYGCLTFYSPISIPSDT